MSERSRSLHRRLGSGEYQTAATVSKHMEQDGRTTGSGILVGDQQDETWESADGGFWVKYRKEAVRAGHKKQCGMRAFCGIGT